MNLTRLKTLPWWRLSKVAVIAATVFFLLYGLIWGERGYLKSRAVRARERAIQQEVEDLKARITALEREQQSLQEGGRAIEKTAREEYLYHRPGEVIILVDPPTPAGDPALVDKKAGTL